jgi:hypothetical protein
MCFTRQQERHKGVPFRQDLDAKARRKETAFSVEVLFHIYKKLAQKRRSGCG